MINFFIKFFVFLTVFEFIKKWFIGSCAFLGHDLKMVDEVKGILSLNICDRCGNMFLSNGQSLVKIKKEDFLEAQRQIRLMQKSLE